MSSEVAIVLGLPVCPVVDRELRLVRLNRRSPLSLGEPPSLLSLTDGHLLLLTIHAALPRVTSCATPQGSITFLFSWKPSRLSLKTPLIGYLTVICIFFSSLLSIYFFSFCLKAHLSLITMPPTILPSCASLNLCLPPSLPSYTHARLPLGSPWPQSLGSLYVHLHFTL